MRYEYSVFTANSKAIFTNTQDAILQNKSVRNFSYDFIYALSNKIFLISLVIQLSE